MSLDAFYSFFLGRRLRCRRVAHSRPLRDQVPPFEKCLLLKLQRAQELRAEGILPSSVPTVKYLAFGLGCFGIGLFAARRAWAGGDVGMQVGLLAGTLIFAIHSAGTIWITWSRGWDLHEYVTFLDANRRWVSEENAKVFTGKNTGEEVETELPA